MGGSREVGDDIKIIKQVRAAYIVVQDDSC